MKHDAAARSESGDRAFVALGSNVGDRIAHLRFAVERLAEHDALRVKACSPVYESAAHTLPEAGEAPSYLNAVVELQSRLGPRELLSFCLEIERARGRDRSAAQRWAPRTLDVDLLLFGKERIREPDLTLPHPRMAKRRFVLRPLADIAPHVRVPAPWKATVRELLATCRDGSAIRRTGYTISDECDDPQEP